MSGLLSELRSASRSENKNVAEKADNRKGSTREAPAEMELARRR